MLDEPNGAKTSDQINTALVGVFKELLDKDPDTAKLLIADAILNRETGEFLGQRQTILPYFKKECAEDVKVVLDQMIADEGKRDFLWRYDSWPELSERSLYLRLHQGRQYLFKFMDKDGKYNNFCKNLQVRQKEDSRGILFKWRPFRKISREERLATPLTESQDFAEVEKKMREFLTDETKATLELKGIVLTRGEVEQLESSMEDLTNVHAVITTSEIKLVKADYQNKL